MLLRRLVAVGFVALGLVLTVPAAAQAEPPSALTDFTPTGVLPGTWTLIDTRPFQQSGGSLDVDCPGSGKIWQRSGDRIQFSLAYATCDANQLSKLARIRAFINSARQSPTLRAASVLGGADLVELIPAEGAVARSWQQSAYDISLACRGSADICLPLTGDAARVLAGRLPGQPVTGTYLPELSQILGPFIAYSLFFVAIPAFLLMLARPRYDNGHGRPRITTVDQAARALRWRSRGRRTGQVFLWFAVIIVAAAIVGVVREREAPTLAAYGFTAFFGLVGAVLVAVCRHPQLSARWLRYWPRLSRVTWGRLASAVLTALVSLLAVAVPFGSLLLLGYLAVYGPANTLSDSIQFFAALVVVGVGVGTSLDRLARRLRARTRDELVDDRRRAQKKVDEILYLRNFGDDGFKVPVSALSRRGAFATVTAPINPFRRARFEEPLARALGRWGAVTGLSDPNHRMPTLGVARTPRLHNETWQAEVEKIAREAHAVVVSATPTELRAGLLWELDLLAHAVPHGHIVLVLNPWPTGDEVKRRFGAFLRATDRFALFHPLNGNWVPDGTLLLVHSPNEGIGSWYAFTARHRTAWTYAAAVDAAFEFAQRVWTAPAGPPAGPLTEPLTAEVTAALDAAVGAGRHYEVSGKPVPLTTRDLLVGLMRASTNADWSRVQLHIGSPEAIAVAIADPQKEVGAYWQGFPMTVSADGALTAATDRARSMHQPVTPGLLALALIASPDLAAAQALGLRTPADCRAMAELIQDDVVGSRIAAVSPVDTRPAAQHVLSAAAAATQPARPARALRVRTIVYSVLVLAVMIVGMFRATAVEGVDTLKGVSYGGLFWIPVLLYLIARFTGSRKYALHIVAIGLALFVASAAIAWAQYGLL